MGLLMARPTKRSGSSIHVGTVTVAAWVPPGSDHAAAVAEQFRKLHNEAPGAWTNEVQDS
jgi:hypothetical protein